MSVLPKKNYRKIQISYYLKTCFCISVPAYVHIYAWKELWLSLWTNMLVSLSLLRWVSRFFFSGPIYIPDLASFCCDDRYTGQSLVGILPLTFQNILSLFRLLMPNCDFVEVSTVCDNHCIFRSCYHTKLLLIYVLHKDYQSSYPEIINFGALDFMECPLNSIF